MLHDVLPYFSYNLMYSTKTSLRSKRLPILQQKRRKRTNIFILANFQLASRLEASANPYITLVRQLKQLSHASSLVKATAALVGKRVDLVYLIN